MRIGLVEYGGWGRVHADVIARIPALTLAAVVCGDEDSARAALPAQVICLEIERAIPERRAIALDWNTPSS